VGGGGKENNNTLGRRKKKKGTTNHWRSAASSVRGEKRDTGRENSVEVSPARTEAVGAQDPRDRRRPGKGTPAGRTRRYPLSRESPRNSGCCRVQKGRLGHGHARTRTRKKDREKPMTSLNPKKTGSPMPRAGSVPRGEQGKQGKTTGAICVMIEAPR